MWLKASLIRVQGPKIWRSRNPRGRWYFQTTSHRSHSDEQSTTCARKGRGIFNLIERHNSTHAHTDPCIFAWKTTHMHSNTHKQRETTSLRGEEGTLGRASQQNVQLSQTQKHRETISLRGEEGTLGRASQEMSQPSQTHKYQHKRENRNIHLLWNTPTIPCTFTRMGWHVSLTRGLYSREQLCAKILESKKWTAFLTLSRRNSVKLCPTYSLFTMEESQSLMVEVLCVHTMTGLSTPWTTRHPETS